MTQTQILLWIVGVIVSVNVLAMVAFVVYAKLPNSRLKNALHKIIFELDRAADNMSNSQKKAQAVSVIRDGLGWKRILVPASLIGLIIDAEVAAIRKMQAVTNTPNLHDEEKSQ